MPSLTKTNLDAVQNLGKALAHYEERPFDSDTPETVDFEVEALRGRANAEDPDHPDTQAMLALCLVTQLALDENGFRFIPAARVLCRAVELGL